MYLAYLDDSDVYDKRVQVVGGIILKDEDFGTLENVLGSVIEDNVPEERRESFEFHASDLFNCRGAFTNLRREGALEILTQCVNMVRALEIPIIYGAVDIDRHRETIAGNAHPISVGFRICAEAVESWLKEKAPSDLAVLVFDDTKKVEVKQAVQTAFRDCRKRVKGIFSRDTRGLLGHVHDDLYFGDSSYSFGIQAADVCTYFISRHLNERKDTEHVYDLLKPNIFKCRTVPD